MVKDAAPAAAADTPVAPSVVDESSANAANVAPECRGQQNYFLCSECGKEFGTEMGLRGHKRWCEG